MKAFGGLEGVWEEEEEGVILIYWEEINNFAEKLRG
jgi:hypothetical protein